MLATYVKIMLMHSAYCVITFITESLSTRLNTTTSTVPVPIATVLDTMTSTIEISPSLSTSLILTSTAEINTTPMLSTTDYTVNPSIQPSSASVITPTLEISNILPSLTVSVNTLATSFPFISPSPSLLPIEITALQQNVNYYVEDSDPVPILVSLSNADFVQK